MLKKMSRIIVLFFLLGMFLQPSGIFARTNVTDWYIKDFSSEIVVNKDSTLDITETVTADCGNAVGKHGIFRILPTLLTIGNTKTVMPVELFSITNQNGQALKYTTTNDTGTVTWKIGDPDVTVQGTSIYRLHYLVKNVIRFDDPKFDELYWNLNGNFWDLQTDHFRASITFPQEINSQNATVDYYAGSLGAKSKDMAAFRWSASNVLEFESTRMLDVRQGITASVIFPKNIFTPYQPSFWEMYGKYLFQLIPLIIFIICFILWWKYGKDPKVDKAIIPEYEAPGNLSPMELGMLMTNGKFDNRYLTAEIINLATKKLIQIKKEDKKIIFFNTTDYNISKETNVAGEKPLTEAQKLIMDKMFEKGAAVKLSSLKNNFYKSVKKIKDSVYASLSDKQLIVKAGLKIGNTLKITGLILIAVSIYLDLLPAGLRIAELNSGVIILLFSFIMPKRTPAGAELNWEIKGFKLFMKTVDKDRAVFYEKENIFEKFLPFAIVFDMTKLWVQRMKEIYGEEYFTTYAPAWYIGNAGTFDADSFSSAIESLSSSIASNTSAPSGSGGGGGAGGGGGGGGGGGW
jgi:uncharacterized membrane protein